MGRFRKQPECGTKSGYDYHVREAKEDPCVPCRAAHSEHWRKQRVVRKDAIGALRREWRKRNPQAKRVNVPKDLVLETYGTKCHICNLEITLDAPVQVGKPGWELSFHPDHLIPLSRGGSDDIENVRPAHAYCNQKKWATVPKEETEE